MLDHAQARALATEWLRENTIQCPCAIVDAYTEEHSFGWVFFYDSVQHIETGSDTDVVAGNAPLIVNRFDESLHVTGTARPTSYYVEQYVSTLQRNA